MHKFVLKLKQSLKLLVGDWSVGSQSFVSTDTTCSDSGTKHIEVNSCESDMLYVFVMYGILALFVIQHTYLFPPLSAKNLSLNKQL